MGCGTVPVPRRIVCSRQSGSEYSIFPAALRAEANLIISEGGRAEKPHSPAWLPHPLPGPIKQPPRAIRACGCCTYCLPPEGPCQAGGGEGSIREGTLPKGVQKQACRGKRCLTSTPMQDKRPPKRTLAMPPLCWASAKACLASPEGFLLGLVRGIWHGRGGSRKREEPLVQQKGSCSSV